MTDQMDSPIEVNHDNYSLSSKYLAGAGEVFLTGVQALARIPIEQLRMDRVAGLNTAGFVSGYPGSPLGGFDLELSRALKVVEQGINIRHLPAVNEELGASAVMGSQLVSARDDATYDGVVGIWYGKAPGLDRATDALRHGVFAGSGRFGGALALVGDDPAAKSSTMPSSSDAALLDLHMPVLYPGDAAECLELGLHGIEMSRATGLWSALKVVTAVADGSGTVSLPVLDAAPIAPAHEVDGEPWHRVPSAQFLGPRMVQVEREFHEVRTGLALEYGRLNKLNRFETNPSDAWLGIVATGFTYGQVMESFRRLGLTTRQQIEDAGIRLLNLRMPLPFDPELIHELARGLDQVLVIEEKNPTLEVLVRSALYRNTHRPEVDGRMNDQPGNPTLPSYGRLDADVILPVLRTHLEPRLANRLLPPEPKPRTRIPLTVNRAPFFCSGCPHNWGTKLPEDAVVGMGTGCHGMTLLMDEERVGESIGITAMGNEGAQWLGMAPFVETEHVFQNFGDGTFMHSGQLALQAAVGAGANVTFKILYNHTVAMTGGQDASHLVGPPELSRILLAHGVNKVVVTTDDVGSYNKRALPSGVDVYDRTKIVEVQEDLAAIPGVTVLIHDQGCAAELRRDRRRGRIEKPTTRVVINHRICEGCGDCGDVSSCLSVQPVETPLGRKTAIDQASCNFDYSCMKGDCPAFMTVEAHAGNAGTAAPNLADFPIDTPQVSARSRTVVRMAGIGGTGVVTIAQVLATAATLDGLTVSGLDQTGLSQKAGPVISDLAISNNTDSAGSNLPGQGQADVMLAFDLLVGASNNSVNALAQDAKVFASTHTTPTGAQVISPELVGATNDQLIDRIIDISGASVGAAFDSVMAGKALVGASPVANMALIGAAVQSGEIPVSIDSMRRAIELNGVAVDDNLDAFEWGRRLFAQPEALKAAIGETNPDLHSFSASPLSEAMEGSLNQLSLEGELARLVRSLTADLVDYQDEKYARRFIRTLALAASLQEDEFTESVARSLHKFMAYKDEYEVARLMTHVDGMALPNSIGTDKSWHLHPPMLAALGRKEKITFDERAEPTFRQLAKGKRLRGTKLDPFGRTAMRRMERELVDEFESTIETLCASLHLQPSPQRLEKAIAIANLPDMVRGFEELKIRRVGEYREQVRLLVNEFMAT